MAKVENKLCSCSKIVFQQAGDNIIIKCRHCKRYTVIETKGISAVLMVDEKQQVV